MPSDKILHAPHTCPHCHVMQQSKLKNSYSTTNDSGEYQIITIHECSNEECERVYPILFDYSTELGYEFNMFLAGFPKGPDFPIPILNLKSGKEEDLEKNIQTRFISTYLQSLVSENQNLCEISGMGYRKSIEYLVKDWAISENPEDREKINKLWLSKVIGEYYEGDLKNILERATWLGNDQAHYNKLFEEYDLNVLKELIGLIMVELDRKFKINHYNKTISKRK